MNVVPAIFIDGEEIARINVPLNLGEVRDFNMTLYSSGNSSHVSNSVKAGSMYAVTLDAQSVTPRELEKSFEEASKLRDTINEKNAYSPDELGRLLAFAGKLYFAQLDVLDCMTANMLNVSASRSLSEAITGYEANTRSVYGITSLLSEGSLYIDVDTDAHSVTYLGKLQSLDDEGIAADEVAQSKEVTKQFMLTAGFLSSYLESAVWEEITGEESVSTIAILEKAANDDVDILTIGKNNLNASLDRLKSNDTGKLSDAIISDVKDAVASGKMVIIPEKETTIGSYTGYGYILLDNDTGAGAYMISGGINGGMSPELVGIASIVDLGIAVYGLVEVVSMLLSMVSLMAAAGPVGIVAGLAASAFLIYLAVDVLAKTFDLVEAAINGDEAAAGQIFTDIVINIAFIIGAKAVSKLLGGFLNKLILNGAIKNCGEEVVERIVKQYGDDALRYLKKYGDDFVRICDTHGDDGYKLVKDFGDNFVKLYAKYGDDVYKYVSIYGDEALKLFKNYGDDLIKAIGKYGDDGFKLYYRFGDKALVYVEQYGDEALKLLTGENGYRAFNEFSNGKTLDEVRKVVEGSKNTGNPVIDNMQNRVPNNEITPPNNRGNAPLSNKDGKPIEIHHSDQEPLGPFKEMHPSDHRYGANYKNNHPNYNSKSKIDRTQFRKWKQEYWENEWDNGRWNN